MKKTVFHRMTILCLLALSRCSLVHFWAGLFMLEFFFIEHLRASFEPSVHILQSKPGISWFYFTKLASADLILKSKPGISFAHFANLASAAAGLNLWSFFLSSRCCLHCCNVKKCEAKWSNVSQLPPLLQTVLWNNVKQCCLLQCCNVKQSEAMVLCCLHCWTPAAT